MCGIDALKRYVIHKDDTSTVWNQDEQVTTIYYSSNTVLFFGIKKIIFIILVKVHPHNTWKYPKTFHVSEESAWVIHKIINV